MVGGGGGGARFKGLIVMVSVLACVLLNIEMCMDLKYL